MAIDFIKVDQSAPATAPLAREVVNAKNLLRQATEAVARVKASMDHATDAAVWTNIETLCGVPSGKGQTLYNLFAGTVTALANVDAKALTEQVV